MEINSDNYESYEIHCYAEVPIVGHNGGNIIHSIVNLSIMFMLNPMQIIFVK